MNKYWFKPKKYGWGFVPISIEGWIATLALLGVSLLSVKRNKIGMEGMSLEGFLVDMAIIITLSSILFKQKTKGKLRFRWGK